jgi:hypothetical protein
VFFQHPSGTDMHYPQVKEVFRKSLIPVAITMSLLFVALQTVSALFTNWNFWLLHFNRLPLLIGFMLAFFWYAVYVSWANERKHFGRFRRPINALLFCGLVTSIVWLDMKPEIVVIVWSCLSLVAGFFADIWVESV